MMSSGQSIRSLALVAALVLCCTGSRHALAVDTVLAKGGTVELGSNDARSLVAALPPATREAVVADLGSMEQLLRAEILRRTLLAEARAKGFDRDPETIRQLEQVRQEATTRLWLAAKSAAPPGYPSEAEVTAAYEAARRAAPVDYHLAQIFIAAPDGVEPAKLAAALRKAIDIGGRLASADFATLARESSEQSASAAKGGDLGLLPENQLLPEVAAVVRAMKPGETAGPIKTAQGLHFIKLLDRQPQAVPPLASVRERIVAALQTRHSQELQQAYLKSVAAQLNIAVDQIELTKLQASLRAEHGAVGKQ